jgi:phosphate transport system permease protein
VDGEAAGAPRAVRLSDGAEAAPPARPAAEVEASRARARRADRVMRGALALCQFLTVVPLFLILGYIAVRGAGA